MTATTEIPGSETARHAMVVSQLRTSGVNDARVVAAMAAVPREDFLPESQRAIAYRDRSLPIGAGRAQNPPLATGLLLTEAAIRPGEKVLIVGAAGGYAAAVAAKLTDKVVAVESDPALAAMARSVLPADVTLVEGPLADGAPQEAPYDVMLVDGAVEHLPEGLTGQVKAGGRIVAGLFERGVTRIATGIRADTSVGLHTVIDTECAVLPGFETPRGFQF